MSVCRVGADVSAVSCNSYPTMCVCTIPDLLTGCYALALVGTCHMTVDCLLPSLICCSALSLWWVDLWSFGYTPSVCLATGIVNLYTVMGLQLALMGLRYFRVPQSCGVQGLRDGVTLSGQICVPLYVFNRIEGSSLSGAEVPWGSLVLRGSGPS